MDTYPPHAPDSSPPDKATLLSIAAVERETGLGKDTLRVWERRYGFPRPERDASGVRGYPRPQVERLRLLRRALLAGHRPGRLLALPPDELDRVLRTVAAPAGPAPALEPAKAAAAAAAAAAAPEGRAALDVDACIAALRVDGSDSLRHWLTLGLARLGLGPFVTAGLVPLTQAIGDAWLEGRIAVYEEHLYSEAVQAVLRNGMLPFQAGLEASAPRVLLTTVPGEQHGLGLLMAEALMTLEACRCLSLGVQTPLDDIVAAARVHRIDVVALSFTDSLPAADALAALRDLRAALPVGVAIWAGGAGALRGRPMAGVRAMAGLAAIPEAVALWRTASGIGGVSPDD